MVSLLGKQLFGLIFIVSAPAGTGKTTLVQMLIKEFSSVIMSVSFTTRLPRLGEVDGKDYHFISEEQFKTKIEAGDFLEYIQLYGGTYYGTSREWIWAQQTQGKHVVLVIDTQGAESVRKQLSTVSIFMRPPSINVLRERLLGRQTESIEVIEKRLEWAEQELKAAQTYDYQIINDDLMTAYQVLKSIIIATCHQTLNFDKTEAII